MGELAKKFVPRAPRYVLRAHDNKIMRYALDHNRTDIYTTTFINLSITGLAFIADPASAPPIGSLIKMEFPVPGAEQIAWWGKVVRIQEYRSLPTWYFNHGIPPESNDVLVAVNFEDLPEGHKNHIIEGLRHKAAEMARHQRLQMTENLFEFIKIHHRKILLFAACTFFTVSLLFWLSRPSENYDAQRGSPWGQRFKFF